MAIEANSFQAMVFEDGKKIKGTLMLLPDSFEFNGKKQNINWEKATVEKGTQVVRKFLLKSEKPTVTIIEGKRTNICFIISNEPVENVISEITRLRDITRQERLEREKQKRKEKAERERREAEERKRQEEERKRKEEEERKRKEEEKRKRIEERKKKEEDRKNRIEKEIQCATDNVKSVNFSEAPSYEAKRAWGFFADNPYRILGISVTASLEEANSNLDKIKKLVRLNAASSFKSDYHLAGTDKPVRDVSIAQNALTNLKNIRYKWFWFESVEACRVWQSSEYCSELLRDGVEYGTYDLFLANYLFALVFDPELNNPELWKPVLSFIPYLSGKGRKLLRSRFGATELEKYTDDELIKSFNAEIFEPLLVFCDSEDVKVIIRLYSIIKQQKSEIVQSLCKKIGSKISTWFKVKEKEINDFTEEYREKDSISSAELNEVIAKAKGFFNEVEPAIKVALDAVKGEKVLHEMIQEAYRNAVWNLMVAANNATNKKTAIEYANKCYFYCNQEDRRKIRNAFGFTKIKGCDNDVTAAEMDIMGDNYSNGENGYDVDYYEAFKWYKKAAEAGNRYSQNSLGICYMKGQGTSKNEYEAAKWFEKAHLNGYSVGTFNLARCYANGNGKPQNRNKALELYAEAAKAGDSDAAEEGRKLLNLMNLEQKLHRLQQHEHYDLGYQSTYPTVIVEVTLNYSANVYLMDGNNYNNYKNCDSFNYYGGRATQSPYRIKIPGSGYWHLIIDNGDDDMTGIVTTVHTRTLDY